MIAECLWSNKARTTSFLNDFKNETLNTLIQEESRTIYVFRAAKIWQEN